MDERKKGDTVTVTINEKEIFYRRAGDRGQPIVFVHGNSLSSRTFQKQLESDLADSYRLFAPDLPGHGQSFRAENPKSDYNPKAYAEMLTAFAREVEAENSIFVGWSLGGHILLEASDLLPDAGRLPRGRRLRPGGLCPGLAVIEEVPVRVLVLDLAL